jgi:hypothetical protein
VLKPVEFSAHLHGKNEGMSTEPQAAVTVEMVDAIEEAGIPYLLVGGIASSLLGRQRATEDIDVLVSAEDAHRVLEALAEVGFETEETNPQWIFKAVKNDVTIDVIFWLRGGITLDDEMLARAVVSEVAGRPVRVIPPEDLVVIKAITNDEQSTRHWHDALAIISVQSLDWTYLVMRARRGARRVLSLLIYAQTDDLIVPDDAIHSLFQAVYADSEAGVTELRERAAER